MLIALTKYNNLLYHYVKLFLLCLHYKINMKYMQIKKMEIQTPNINNKSGMA